MVGCAGCGRVLESEFMELDHITPKGEGGADNILNRVLLCRSCNGRKSNTLTMMGLRRENNRVICPTLTLGQDDPGPQAFITGAGLYPTGTVDSSWKYMTVYVKSCPLPLPKREPRRY